MLQGSAKSRYLTDPSPELAPRGGWHIGLPDGVVKVDAASADISLGRLDELGAVDNLVAEVEDGEEDEGDIGDEEVGDIPWHEGLEALGEDDEDVEEQAVVGVPWLEEGLVWKNVARDVLVAESALEADVGNVDVGPCNETGDSGDVEEPVKNSSSGCGQVQVGEETDSGSGENGVVWHTLLGSALEESWCGTIVGETDEDTGAGVDVGVCSRKDDKEEDSVDDAWEMGNTSTLSSNDEWRGGSIRLVGVEALIVVWDQDTNEEDGEDEEEQDTPEGLLDGAWNVLAWVLSLSGRDTDKLGSLVRETSLDHDGPETDKLGERIRWIEKVWCKCSWVFPELEAKVTLLPSTSIDADTEDEEAANSDDLDHGEPEFELSIEGDRHHVASGDEDPEDGDEYSNV